MSTQRETRLTWGVKLGNKIEWFDIENNAFYNAKALGQPVLRRVEVRVTMTTDDIVEQEEYDKVYLPYSNAEAMLSATGKWVTI